jgi:hypothetical protein
MSSTQSTGNANVKESVPSSLWSWGGLAEGLSTISGAAATSGDDDGHQAEVGASNTEIKELESKIANVENAVWSTFSSVSDTLIGTTTGQTTKDSPADIIEGQAESTDEEDENDTNDPKENKEIGAGASEVELKTMESQIADAEAAVSSFFSSVSNTFGTIGVTDAKEDEDSPPKEEVSPDNDLDKLIEGRSEVSPIPTSTAAGTSSSLWSAISAVSEDPTGSIMNLYSNKVNQASEWIEDLEKEQQDQDPYRNLKNHLDAYVTANPRGAYEEWVRLWISEHGWGGEDDQKEGDDDCINISYYQEESVHRNHWNERNYEDGINIDDEDPQRSYVVALKNTDSSQPTVP